MNEKNIINAIVVDNNVNGQDAVFVELNMPSGEVHNMTIPVDETNKDYRKLKKLEKEKKITIKPKEEKAN